MSNNHVLDPDDPTSWPDTVAQLAESVSARVDLDEDPFLEEEESLLRHLLAEERIVAYHATRLLADEKQAVKQRGLRPLDESLILDRLQSAVAAGVIEQSDADLLFSGNALRSRADERREGQICLGIGTHVFEHQPSSVNPLLRTWGGEAINFTEAAHSVAGLIGAGRPTLIEVELPVLAPDLLVSHPPICSLLIRQLRGEPRSSDAFWRAGPLGPEAIRGVYQPGDPAYDRFAHLVRK